jgi:hypothetical protein
LEEVLILLIEIDKPHNASIARFFITDPGIKSYSVLVIGVKGQVFDLLSSNFQNHMAKNRSVIRPT